MNGNDVQEQDTDCPAIIINEEKVRSKLLVLKEDKAQEPDDIHPAVLKNCADTSCETTVHNFQQILAGWHSTTRLEACNSVSNFQKGR